MELSSPPGIWYGLRRRQESISEEAKEIAWKAQHRLHKRYMKLGAAGKDQRKMSPAVARELLALYGLSEPEPRLFQAASCSLTTTKAKVKTSKKEKAKNTGIDDADIHLEHRGRQQPGQARRRTLAWPMRQARPDSR